MVSHVRGRLSTTPVNFIDIITDIRRGEIKIPKFQRPFVWKSEQALDLLDSIASGYPIGSVLLWRTSDKLKAERSLGEFILPTTDDMTPTKYVLDGQQRITVIYSSFGADRNDPGFSPMYDLRLERFHAHVEPQQIWHFPLRIISKTTDLLNFRQGLLTLADSAALQGRLDALIGAINDYRLPVVELRDLTVEEVCPIFERINSSGTKLSTFDLIAAATWTQEFDLSDHADAIAEAVRPRGFQGMSKDTILKCIATLLISSVKKEDILKIRERPRVEVADAAERTRVSLLRSIDHLHNEFGIQAMAFLPYEAHLLCLCRVFSGLTHLTAEQNLRLRRWFWRSSFSQHYRGASEAFITTSLADASAWVVDGTGAAEAFGAPPTAEALRNMDFHFRSATSKAHVIALAKRQPSNMTNGVKIDLSEALSSYNNRQYHHVFPKAYLRNLGRTANIDSHCNIVMLSASENNRISDAEPSIYVPAAVAALGGQAPAVFSANLLPDPGAYAYETADFDQFLTMRGDLLEAYISKLCDGHH